MLNRSAACAVVVAVLSGLASAVPPPKVFINQYVGPAGFYDIGKAVTTDAAGNIYAACESSTGTGSQIVVVKYSPSGAQQWVYSYAGRPGGGNDRPFSIKIDSGGWVIVGGQSSGAGPSLDYVVIKINATTGLSQWVTRWDDTGSGFNGLSELALGPTGDVYATGQSYGGLDYDWGTMKLSGATGAILWAHRLDGFEGGPDGINDAATSIAVDSGGNAYVCGWFQVGYDFGEEINLYAPGVARYDADGTLAWRIALGDSANQGQGARVRVGPDGNPIVASNMAFGGVRTAKLSATNGAMVWMNNSLGPTGNGESVYDMAIDPAGDAILTGGACGGTPFCAEGVNTRKIESSDGITEWNRNIFDSGNPNTAGGSGRGIAIAPNGTIYVAGFQIYFNSLSNPGKAVAVAYDSAGTEQWSDLWMLPGSTSTDFGAVAAAANSTPVFVGVNRVAPQNRMLTVRYARCQPDLTTTAVPGSPGYGVANGVLNNDDFFYYLSQFSAGNLGVADLTTSAVPGGPGYGTPNGIINNDDFFYYLSLFAAGC